MTSNGVKKNPEIAIIDYGLSNLYSISKALRCFTDNVFITDELSGLNSADAVVLPGVGAFEEGMNGLKTRGLENGLKEFVNFGKPLLGICLGAQLMLSRGYEFGAFDGLDIIKGEVVRFPELKDAKIPHIGWNEIYPQETGQWDKTIFDFSAKKANMYFVHSYIMKPSNKENIFALSNYGGHEFCSALRSGNIYGCQFHPEKSGEEGLKIIENFIKSI
ncbi:MAG: imidazole glycerol phosphate synthase subunit HisH [Patescibacteria group bacterium]